MQFANGIKAILFDFDGTLRHHLPTGGEVFTDYVVESLGLPITDEDRLRAARWEHYYFANSPEIQADQKLFQEKEEAFWFHFAHRRLMALGCLPDLVPELGPKASAYMQENYMPEVFVPEDVHTALPGLREAGYTLGVVSNRTNPYQNEVDEMEMGVYFQFSLAAGEVNVWKPEPGIFEHALEMTGTTPEQTLYIGDNYFADVVGARRAGLQPVLYDLKGLFYEPGCPVITSFDELTGMLK
jgi:HAD superfamily hydrolase (TIGR01662 family)